MKKVYLHFKECRLGYLAEVENVFVWVPDIDAITSCFNKYDGARDLFFLAPKEEMVYEKIPAHFDEFVFGAEREDLAKSAKIVAGDSDFDKLCKMATLNYMNQDFYISI